MSGHVAAQAVARCRASSSSASSRPTDSSGYLTSRCTATVACRRSRSSASSRQPVAVRGMYRVSSARRHHRVVEPRPDDLCENGCVAGSAPGVARARRCRRRYSTCHGASAPGRRTRDVTRLGEDARVRRSSAGAAGAADASPSDGCRRGRSCCRAARSCRRCRATRRRPRSRQACVADAASAADLDRRPASCRSRRRRVRAPGGAATTRPAPAPPSRTRPRTSASPVGDAPASGGTARSRASARRRSR